MVELIWDGKYDRDGRKVAPVRVALPFQDIETVNESAQQRQLTLDRLTSGRDATWRNRLIWGDKKYVLPSLLPEFAGKVDLIYIDPPFATSQDFSFDAMIPDDPETEGDQSRTFPKQASILERKAYRDTWGVAPDERSRGVTERDKYIKWFYETAILLRDLLSETGVIYVHLDWHVGHYVKCVLDDVFGEEHFRNEIVWIYGGSGRGAKAIASQFPRNHDVIFVYSKTNVVTYNTQVVERRVRTDEAHRAGYRQDDDGRWFKTAPRGDYTDESVKALDAQGRIHRTRTGGIRIKYFLRSEVGFVVEDAVVGDAWTDIPDAMHLPDAERRSYATQKPEALLRRVIQTSCNEGDLVLDCFVGSGTTAIAAEGLNRRWIAADLGRFAIHTTRKGLLSLSGVRSFVVQNLGKYERQAWQQAEFGSPEDAAEREQRYRRFILDLYRATPIDGRSWLHGMKAGRMVHVGSVDAPVTQADVRAAAAELIRTTGTGDGAPARAALDILGWEFALEVNELAKQVAAEAGVDVAFRYIPREVLEKRAVEQGDIQFFELNALSVGHRVEGRTLKLWLRDFMMSPDGVPEDVMKGVTHWSQWVDYWAVDWDYRGDTFHNQWQSYRTKKDPKLETEVNHTYDSGGSYRVLVKVIDILGNDTTAVVQVEVP